MKNLISYVYIILQDTVKYDKLLTDNAKTRRAVDSLLKDRTRFNELSQKLASKLNADKKKLLALINQASVACQQKLVQNIVVLTASPPYNF